MYAHILVSDFLTLVHPYILFVVLLGCFLISCPVIGPPLHKTVMFLFEGLGIVLKETIIRPCLPLKLSFLAYLSVV